MILTTCPGLENAAITQYLGVVTGEAVTGAHLGRDFLAAVRDLVGGRSKGYEKALQDTRASALRDLQETARAAGADAVVGIHLDYTAVGKTGSMLVVAAVGTAVKTR